MIACFDKNRHVYLTGYDVSDSRNVSTTRTQQLGPTPLASTNVRDSSKDSPTSSALLIKADNWQTEGYFHKYSQFSTVPKIPPKPTEDELQTEATIQDVFERVGCSPTVEEISLYSSNIAKKPPLSSAKPSCPNSPAFWTPNQPRPL